MAEITDNTSEETYETRVLRAIRKIIRAVDIHSRRLNKDFRITTPQLICLHALGQRESTTLNQLANEVSLGASTTTGIVDRLQAKGLVSRTRSQQDRRKLELSITDSGREMLACTPTLLQERFSQAFSVLTQQVQAQLTESLEKVVTLMNAEHLSTSPNLVIGDAVINAEDQNKEVF